MSNLDKLPEILDFIQVSIEEFETAYISRASFDALRVELAAARVESINANNVIPTMERELRAARQRIKELEEENRWHKWPAEVPPLTSEYYLAHLTNGRVEKVVYYGPKDMTYPTWKIAGKESALTKLITHWRPLPEPPSPEA